MNRRHLFGLLAGLIGAPAELLAPEPWADAAKAFSGTYASVAGIPYVGWIKPPAAAAADMAGIGALRGLPGLDVGRYP